MAAPAVEIRRGDRVESVARADAAVVDSSGRLVAWVGDPRRETFWRSGAKPFQAIPVVASGAMAAWDMGVEELAVIAGSHHGEPAHVQIVRGLLARLGASPTDLVSGPGWPLSHSARETLRRRGEVPDAVYGACSGKHAGMLALASQLGSPRTGYDQSSHPVQAAIARVVALYCGYRETARIPQALDGCGVPTFFLPLSRMAWAYARLGDPRGVPDLEGRAGLMVAEAMRRHPHLTAGADALEVRLAHASGGRVVAKTAAEAVFCATIPERGWGLAFKMEDGGGRTVPSMAAALLALVGPAEDEARDQLMGLARHGIHTADGREAGEMAPVFQLQRGQVG